MKEKIFRKLINLKNLCVYCNTENESFVDASPNSSFIEKMSQKIYRGKEDIPSNHFLIKPVSGTVKILLDNRDDIDFSSPKKKLEFDFNSVNLCLSKSQFRSLSNSIRSVLSFNKMKSLHDRPLVNPSKDPRAWWKYVINFVMIEQQEKRKSWSWDRIEQYRSDRHYYRHIYKKRRTLGKRRLKEDEKAKLEHIESVYRYEDILLFRKLANMDKKKEKKEGKKKDKLKDSGEFKSKAKSKLMRSLENSVGTIENSEAIKELYESIGYEETTTTTKILDLPLSYEKNHLDIAIKGLSFTGYHDVEHKVKFVYAEMTQISAAVIIRPNSFAIKGSLKSLYVDEFYSLKTKNFVFLKSDTNESTPVIHFLLDKNPPNHILKPDYLFQLKVQPLYFKISKPFIDAIYKFAGSDKSIIGLRAAKSKLSSLRKKGVNNLTSVIKKRKVIDLDVDLVAPKIIIPEDLEKNSSSLVLDLGHISAKTKRDSLALNVEGASTNAPLYDDYNIVVNGVTVYMSPWDTTKKSSLLKRNVLIRKLDICFLLKVLSNSSLEQYPRFKIKGTVKSLNIDINKIKIHLLANAIKNLTKNQGFKMPKKKNKKGIKEKTNVDSIVVNKKKKILLSEFEVTKVMVTLSHSNDKYIETTTPLMKCVMKSLRVYVHKSVGDLHVKCLLEDLKLKDSFMIETGIAEKVKTGLYLIKTINKKDEPLIEIKYRRCGTAFLTDKVIQTTLDVFLNTTEVYINRPTIAVALNLIQSYAKIFRKLGTKRTKSSRKLKPVKPSKTSNQIKTKVDIYSKDLKIILNRCAKPFLLARLSGLSAEHLVYFNGDSKFSGKIKSISAKDKNEVLWKDILTIGHDANTELVTFNLESFKSPDLHKHILDVQASHMKITIVQKLITELITYFGGVKRMRAFANKFKKSKQSKKKLDPSKRLKYNVSLANVSIIVPENSEDAYYATLNVDSMHLANNVTLDSNGVILDLLQIKCKGFSVFGSVNDDTTTAKKVLTRQILSELDFDLEVLSKFNNPSLLISNTDMSILLDKIQLSVTESELNLILGIVAGNLSEFPSRQDGEMDVTLRYMETKLSPRTKREEIVQVESGIQPVDMISKLMQTISIKLGDIDATVLRGTGTDSKHSSTAFAHVSAKNFSLHLGIHKDNSKKVQFSLGQYVVNSTRNNPRDDTPVRIASGDLKLELNHTINVNYHARPKDRYQVVNFIAYHPTIYVTPYELEEIKTFLQPFIKTTLKTVSIFSKKKKFGSKLDREKLYSAEEKRLQEIFDVEIKEINQEQNLFNEECKKNKFTVEQVKAKKESFELKMRKTRESQKTILKQKLKRLTKSAVLHRERHVKVELIEPNIFVPERELDASEFMELRINYLSMKLLIEPTLQIVSLNAYELDLYKCASEKSYDIKEKVCLVKPFDLSVDVNRIKEIDQQLSRIDLNVGHIESIISYRDVIFMVSAIKSFKHDYGGRHKKKSKVKTMKYSQSEQISFNLNIKEIVISILNDASNHILRPLLKAHMEQLELFTTKNEDIRANVLCGAMSLDSYNQDLATYEPFVEPCKPELFFTVMGKKTSLSLKIDSLLNINVTNALISTLMEELAHISSLKKTFKSKKSRGGLLPSHSFQAAERSFNPFVVKNQTCKTIRFWFSKSKEKTITTIEADEERPVIIDNAAIQTNLEIDVGIVFADGNLVVLKDITLDKIHSKAFIAQYEGKNYQFISHIVRQGGTKVLILKTTQTICNTTHYPLNVVIFKKNAQYTLRLYENQETSIPIEFQNYTSISISPDGFTPFEWIEKETHLALCPSTHTSELWSCVVDYQHEEVDSTNTTAITIKPMLSIENLLSSHLLIKFSNSQSAFSESVIDIAPGGSKPVFVTSNSSIMNDYIQMCIGGFYWTDPIDISILFHSKDTCMEKIVKMKDVANNRDIEFVLEVVKSNHLSLKLSIYAQYWIVNQSGIRLNYRQGYRSGTIEDDTTKKLDFKGDPRYWYINPEDSGFRLSPPHNFYYSGDEIQIQVYGKSTWSNGLNLAAKDSKKSTLDYDIKFATEDTECSRLFEFYSRVQRAPGKYWRTQEIRISPQRILVNQSKYNLVYSQDKENHVYELLSGDQIPYHWDNKKGSRQIAVNFRDVKDPTYWSSPFCLDDIDNFVIKLRKKDKVSEYLTLNISSKEINGVYYTIFKDTEENLITYHQIDNRTEHEIHVSQKDVPKEFKDIYPASHSAAYFWDFPHDTFKSISLSLASGGYSYILRFDDTNLSTFEWKVSSKLIIPCSLKTSGYMKILTIGTDSFTKPTDGDLKLNVNSTPVEEKKSFEFELEFPKLGISVIDSLPQEVMYVTLRQTLFKYKIQDKKQSYHFAIKTAQLDNQIHLCPSPILGYGDCDDNSDFLECDVELDKSQKKILYVKQARFKLKPIYINADQVLIFALASFATNTKKRQKSSSGTCKVEDVIPLLQKKNLGSDKCYFQNIKFEGTIPIVSLRLSDNTMFTPVINQKLNNILSRILKISSIERQKIRLPEFHCPSAFCAMKDMKRRITTHYKNSIRSNVKSLVLGYITKIARNLLSSEQVVPVVHQRPPRYFPPDNTVVVYDLTTSYGQKILRSIFGGEYHKEHYFFHYFISGNEMLLASHKLILFCKTPEDATPIWKDRLDELAAYVVDELSIRLYFDPRFVNEDPHERSIACRTMDQVRYISSMLDLAVAQSKFSVMTTTQRDILYNHE